MKKNKLDKEIELAQKKYGRISSILRAVENKLNSLLDKRYQKLDKEVNG